MNHKQSLLTKIENRSAVIGVVGLGYVGLPLALAYASRGFKAHGFDIDGAKVQALRAGESYIEHIAAADIARQVDSGRLVPTCDFALLRGCDAILICVPTPLTAARDPDLSYVISTTQQIARALSPGKLVVLESTTYPGTTEEVVRPILEQSGLVAGKDFFLAFSPEREDPGNAKYTTVTIPKVVGGCGADAADVAERLYAQVISKVVRVSNAATAEATKITENVFRAVNIALVNELKVVYERMGIDIWEVLDAAATKPFGFMRFNPGPGWGGHCIPLDPFYLSWKARAHDVDTKFIELAGEINRAMSEYVVARVQRALNDRGRAVRGSEVMLLGLAYKKDVGDTRESPAFPIARQLIELGASLSYHDPYLKELPETRAWAGRAPFRSVSLTPDQLARHDAVVIVTDHSNIDYGAVLKHSQLIIDSRGVYRGPHDKVVRA